MKSRESFCNITTVMLSLRCTLRWNYTSCLGGMIFTSRHSEQVRMRFSKMSLVSVHVYKYISRWTLRRMNVSVDVEVVERHLLVYPLTQMCDIHVNSRHQILAASDSPSHDAGLDKSPGVVLQRTDQRTSSVTL